MGRACFVNPCFYEPQAQELSFVMMDPGQPSAGRIVVGD